METVKPHHIYHTHMVEAKIRLISSFQVLGAEGNMLGLPALEIEFCFLQIRRIIELITFSAMIREEDRYRKAKEIAYTNRPNSAGDASKDWNATEILKILVKVSPDILPIPTKTPLQIRDGRWHFDRKELSVNHARLIEIYKLCSGFLHAKNPLVSNFQKLVEAERKKLEEANVLAEKNLNFLKTLLWNHVALTLEWTDKDNPEVNDSASEAWIIEFGEENSQDISIKIGVATD